MEYSKEFRELTDRKLFSLIKLDKDNVSNLEDIITPPEYIYKGESSYRYHIALKVGKYVGRCCFSWYDNGITRLNVNAWSKHLPNDLMRANIKNNVIYDNKLSNLYFLFISENESDHVKLKLMM